jgi:hypothetical protein
MDKDRRKQNMSITKRIVTLWKNQTVTIKAAIIAGGFSIFVAFCTSTGGIVALFANHYLSTLSSESMSPLIYQIRRNAHFTTTSILFIEMYGQDYSGAVPTTCVQADYSNGSSIERFDKTSIADEAQRQQFAFDLVTEKPLVITDAEIILQKYNDPPSEKDINKVSFYDPPGMGSVPSVFFPETRLNKSVKRLSVTRKEGSLKLDPGDAVTLVFPVVFLDPGSYQVQFIIHGQLDLGREVVFNSDTYSYGWMYIDDITRLPIKTLSGTAIKWLGACP